MTDEEKGRLAKILHELILESVPGTRYLAKYGGVLYTQKPREKESQFCGVFIYRDHVQLVFRLGARLKDRSGLLLGQGKSRRHINFFSGEEVPRDAVATLLRQAAKY